jgi:hypothetical protein
MKHSQLKQLIREELKKALSENTYEVGETILWKGGSDEVIEDDGGPTLKIQLTNGNIKLVFRKDTSLPLNESPYPLIPRKDIIANALAINDIPDEEFEPQQSKDVVVSFILNGRPSETYLEKMMGILRRNGVEVTFPKIKYPKTNFGFKENPNINPYEQPGGRPSKGGWTGD